MWGLYNYRLQWLGKKSKPLEHQLSSAEKEKVKALETLGFAFDYMFDVNLQKLEAFKAREGHCKVPNKYDPDKKLANWVGQVRREHNYLNRGEKSEYLTVDRLRKLATIGFVFWGRHMDVPWEVNFDKLKAYREEHDGLNPHTSHPELGS